MKSELIYRIAGEILMILALVTVLLYDEESFSVLLVVFAVWCNERADYHRLLNGIKGVANIASRQ